MPRRALLAPAVAAAIAAVYLVWAPASADLAAATYRAGLFARAGFVVYDPQWYGGFEPLGYSVLLGPLGALLGVRLLGAASAVAAAALFARLAGGSRPAALWFAVGVGVSLGSGRTAFTLGVALGLGALVAVRAERPWAGGVLAAASALASPLTGGFLGLAAVAGAPDPERRSPRARAGLAAAALGPAAGLALAFPTAGYEPFAASSFWPALGLLVLLAAAAPPALRAGVVLYALACVAAYAVPTAVGGNAVRLGALFAGPLAAAALGGDRRRLLALLALPLAYWQLQAPIRDVVVAHGDPSTTAAYYAPLERLLARGGPRRIEVPFTREHWEAAFLAPRVALARGWERQLDIADNGLFYRRSGLTAAAYAAWLAANGVSVVALADAPLDYSAVGEAALIRRGLPFLRPLARLAHWRVYAVVGAPPLASPPARLVAAGPDRFVLRFARAGTSVVRLRFTDYWVPGGGGCAGRAPGGFTAVTAAQAGRLTVVARLRPAGLLGRAGGCAAGGRGHAGGAG